MAQKGQSQISLPKHKTISQTTKQFSKTQISLQQEAISQKETVFRFRKDIQSQRG